MTQCLPIYSRIPSSLSITIHCTLSIDARAMHWWWLHLLPQPAAAAQLLRSRECHRCWAFNRVNNNKFKHIKECSVQEEKRKKRRRLGRVERLKVAVKLKDERIAKIGAKETCLKKWANRKAAWLDPLVLPLGYKVVWRSQPLTSYKADGENL